MAIPPGRTLCMGDGANDRYMLEAAGIAIGFQPKEAIYAVLDGALFGGDWRALPELLDVDSD